MRAAAGGSHSEDWHDCAYGDVFVEAVRSQHAMMTVTLRHRQSINAAKVASVQSKMQLLEVRPGLYADTDWQIEVAPRCTRRRIA